LEQNNIIYEEFTDGTPTVTGDDAAMNVMMPFYFPYGGEEYNYVRICTNGWVGLGNDLAHTAYANDIGSTAYYRLLAACWDDLQVNAGTGTMTYRTEGAEPNRVFAIQYKNVNRLGATSDLLNFQVRLYESSGEISFTYGNMNTTYTGWTASIGVSGLEGGANDFISITPGLSSTYSSTTANNSINAGGITLLSNKKYSILPEGDYVFLSSPVNGSVNEVSLTLTWEEFPSVVSYHVQVATTADFSEPVIDDEGIIGEEYDLTDLDELTRYFWRVRAITSDELSNWSQVWNFLTTGELPPPVLIAPENGITNADPAIKLRWEGSMYATHYAVQAATDPDFFDIVKEETDIRANSFILTGLSMNTEYFWRARMLNLYDESDWSDAWSFTTGNYAVVGIGENFDTDYYNYVSPSPYSNWYHHSRLYFLYTAEELLAGGAIPNTYITEFGWNVAVNQSNVGTLNPGEFAIRMKLTNWTQLTNQWTYEDWQTVWVPESPWLVQLGWNLHTCIDPFFWDGESSILVETCFSHWDRTGNANPQQYWTTTPVARVQQRTVYEPSGPELDYCTIEENIGWGGPMMNRANIKFGITEAALLIPELLSPENGAIAVEVNPLFMWQPVEGAETYRIQVSTFSNFETTVIDEESLFETEYQVPDGYEFDEMTTYYWRVNASDSENTSFWSQKWSFITVGELPVPVLLSPENGATGVPASTILTWEEYFAATEYTVEVALDEYFEEIAFSETVQGATSVIATGLALNTEYFWHAKMANSASESQWCEPWAFTTSNEVIVGVGTSYDTDYYNYVSPSPYSNWYNHARIYFLYTAEELLNAGAIPNTYLTNFGWNIAVNQSNVGTLNPGEYAIRMKLTPMTQLNGTWNYEDWQTVWEPESPWLAQLGWNMHECIDPLFWDGQSSILVETCMSHWDRTGNPNPQQYWTYTPQVRCQYRSVYAPDGPEMDYCDMPEAGNGTQRNNRANIKFIFEETAIGIPDLLTPEDGAVGVSVTPLFTWNPVDGAESYRIQIATDRAFAIIVMDEEDIYGAGYQVPDGYDLEEMAGYYWRVNATDGENISFWSSRWYFVTEGSLPTPVLLSPENGATEVPASTILKWRQYFAASSYSIQVALDEDFGQIVFDESTQGDTTIMSTGLALSTQYYWRAKMANAGGESEWCEPWSFTTGTEVIVGLGTSYDTDYYNYVSPSPYSNWYSHARIYFLYTAEELLDAGAIPNTFITEFGWDVAVNQSSVGTLNPGEYHIKMKLTPMTQLNGTWNYEDWHTVWEPESPWLAQLGWNMHECIDPIFWDGESSILIETCFSHWDRIGNANPQQHWTYTPQVRCQYRSVYDPNGPNIDYCSIPETGNGTQKYNRANIKFKLEESALAIPELVSPENGAIAVTLNPLFTWNSVEGAATYRIQVSRTINFDDVVIDEEGLAETEYQVPAGYELYEMTTHYWRVNASDDENTSFWSSKWSFITEGTLPPPTLLSPANGATDVPASTILTWEEYFAATGYEIQVALDESFEQIVFSAVVEDANSVITEGLALSTQYYWRARMFNNADESQWCETWTFTTGNIVIVGTGDSYDTDYYNYVSPSPYSNWYSHARLYFLYTAEELLNAGAIPNSYVTSFGWNVAVNQSNIGNLNPGEYAIRMKLTNWTQLSNQWTYEDWQTVWEPASPWLAQLGWNTHECIDPFFWDGVSSILVETCFSHWDRIGNPNPQQYWTYTSQPRCQQRSVYEASGPELDYCTIEQNIGWGGPKNNRANIRFSLEQSALPVPTLLTPEDGTLAVSVAPLFLWYPIDEATSYSIQVATDRFFENIVMYEENLSEAEYQVPDGYELEEMTGYYWRVNASDEENTSYWSFKWYFITEGDIPAPVLVSPDNGTENLPPSTYLTWEPYFAATGYRLQVSLSPEFESTVINTSTTATSYLTSGLSMDAQYYWRVQSYNESAESPWCEPWAFATGNFFTIGQATTNTNSYPAPYGNLYWGAKHQLLIRADEILDAGGLPGSLSSLSFNVAALNSTNPLQNFTIRIKTTNLNVLNSTWDTEDFQTVYVNPSYICQVGLNTHVFDDPYFWDGESNLLIDICFQNTNYQNNQTMYYTNSGYNSVRYYYADVNDVCTNPASCYLSTNRSNMLFEIEVGGLMPPQNLLPSNGAYDVELTPTFDWSDVEDATNYGLIVATDPGFLFPVINEEWLSESYYEVPEGTLEPLTLYYWKANASNDESTSLWSQRWWFGTTGDLQAPALINPPNFATGIPATVPFEWEDIFGAFNYNIQIASDQNFSNIIVDQEIEGNANFEAELSMNSSYFWRVRASSPSSISDWSEVWRFVTGSFFVIGTGTNYNGEYEYPAPYGNYWWGAKHQILVRASEMTQAGGQAGDLTSISFNVQALNNIANLSGFTIKLKQTTATTLDANWDTQGFTTVFTNNSLPVSLGWNTHMFATPFPWDGSSNILVDICFNNTSYTRNAGTYYTNSSYNSVRYFYSDASTVCTNPGSASLSANRPNIMFSGGGPTEPLPPAPVLISPTNTAQNQSITPLLTWESVEEAETYRVQVSRNTNFTTTVVNLVTDETEHQITGALLYLTQYYWRVRSITESGTAGDWSSAWSFRTAEEVTIPENWEFTETDNFAQIVVPATIEPMIGDRELTDGDAIGLFYERTAGQWYCAGYDLWSSSGAAITVYGDDASTMIKDGYDLNEAFVFRVWDKVAQRELSATATFLMGPEAYEPGGFSMLSGLNILIPVTHNIHLSTGWNLISSYTDVFGTRNFANMFDAISTSVNIAKDGYGNMYIPSQSINTIGNWHYVYGYSVNMSQSAILSITAPKLRPENIGFGFDETGWHLIGYLRDNPMSAPIALASVNEDMFIAKNNVGGIYSPVYGINTLGNLVPGQGYWVYLTSENANITYPANNAGRALAGDDITPTAKHLIPELSITGNSATLLLSINASDGNEIGVYNAKNELIGSGAVYNGIAAITIWGDNPITNSIDGALDGEFLTVKLFNPKANSYNDLMLNSIVDITKSTELDAILYSENAIYSARGVVIAENAYELSIRSTPNPASSATTFEFTLPSEGNAEIVVYTIRGDEVGRINLNGYSAGMHRVNFDLSDLSSAVYNIVLTSGENRVSSFMIVNK
jgi:hypothetical protein